MCASKCKKEEIKWCGMTRVCCSFAPLMVFEFLRFKKRVVPWSAGLWLAFTEVMLFSFVFGLCLFFGVSCSAKERPLGGQGKVMATFG